MTYDELRLFLKHLAEERFVTARQIFLHVADANTLWNTRVEEDGPREPPVYGDTFHLLGTPIVVDATHKGYVRIQPQDPETGEIGPIEVYPIPYYQAQRAMYEREARKTAQHSGPTVWETLLSEDFLP